MQQKFAQMLLTHKDRQHISPGSFMAIEYDLCEVFSFISNNSTTGAISFQEQSSTISCCVKPGNTFHTCFFATTIYTNVLHT